MRPRKLDRELVLSLYESGLSKPEIAKKFGVTRAAVYQVIEGYNLRKKKTSEAKKRKLLMDVEIPFLPKGKA